MDSNRKHHTPATDDASDTTEMRLTILEREVATITERMQHLATKEDLAELKAAQKIELAQMETRLQKEFHKELGSVRGEFHKEFGSVKDEIAASERRILRFLTITMIGFVTIIFSALALILNYLQ